MQSCDTASKMSLLKNFILIFIGMCGFLGVRIYRQTFGPLPKPNVDVAAYWGPGDRASYKEDTTVHPFKISYSAEVSWHLKKTTTFLIIIVYYA